MTSMLPPTRDLPPGRQTRIRAELERAVDGRRRTSRFTVPLLAAAAAVAVVATGVVLLRPAPTGPSPAVHITTAPPTTTTSADFGVPPETVAAIEEGCAKSTGMVGKAKLHQLLNEQTRWALLYTDREFLDCSLGAAGMEYNSGFGGLNPKWLPGHFSVDGVSAHTGGDLDGRPGTAGKPGYRTVVGRVDSRVARVTISIDDRTEEAKVANGTFALRLYYPSNWAITNLEAQPAVQAFDAEGKVLGTSSDLRDMCYFNPDNGEIVHGDRRKPKEQCQVVTPWK